jgi:hypothetical protein
MYKYIHIFIHMYIHRYIYVCDLLIVRQSGYELTEGEDNNDIWNKVIL